MRALRPRAVLVVLVGLALAIQVLRMATAEAMWRAGFASQSITLVPEVAQGWSVLAAERLLRGDSAGSSAAAVAALRRAPIDQRALTAFALSGPTVAAGARMGLAATLGWRYLPAQLWLAQAGLAIKDATLLATRLDSYSRQADDPAPIFALVDGAATDPAMRAAIVARLATRPGWRAPYLSSLRDPAPASVAARAMLLAALAQQGAPAERTELLPYIRALAYRGDAGAARDLWTRFVARRDRWSGLLYDGRFATIGDGDSAFPFEWVVYAANGAEVQADGDGLALTNDGTAGDKLLEQQLALTPGRYRLTVHATTDGAAADDGFRWSARCEDGVDLQPAGDESQAMRVGEARYDLIVPAGCATQRLQIVGLPGLPGQTRALRLRDARIDRVPAA